MISPPSALGRMVLYLAAGLVALAVPKAMIVTRWYFLHQDAPAAIAMIGLFVLALRWTPAWRLPTAAAPMRLVLAMALLLALSLWWGTYAVMRDYPLTRDELMVGFDGAIFAAGALALPLPALWSGYALALVPDFLLDVPGHALLVSNYMPVNAALRAGFAQVADPALLNPLLAAGGLVLLHGQARRLFVDCTGARWVVLAGYLLSAQILVTAMAPYAMTAHLAFNLLWLSLFLRDRWWSHGAAMLVGAAAIGLHQVVFHPLFAGPFILTLLAARRWRLFGVYALAYAAALLFWISWPQIVVATSGLAIDPAAGAGTAGGASFLHDRVLPLLRDRDPRTIPLMLYNLLRATTWNAAFVVPFAILALPAIRRGEGLARPLVAGVLLTLLAMTVLLPYQGHGWGYRYLHGLLGNAILLAGYGYREISRRTPREAEGLTLLLALGTLPILVWQVVTAHRFVVPYAQLTQLIERQRSDVVILDTEAPFSAIDQVRNRADLSNRPLVVSSVHLSPEQVAALCARGTVTLLGRQHFPNVGFAPGTPADATLFARRTAPIAGRACLRAPVR